jgi:sulfoxide reductase heme-binding subunit YedZ
MHPATRLWGLRLAVWLLALAPLGLLGWRLATGRLGPNPVETLEHVSGLWALRLLLLTLAMTPLRERLGLPELVQVRRLIGLWTFAFASLHFSIYLVFDLGLSPAQLAEDLLKRSYIALGFAAWLLMLPLAVTSTRGWQRRLKRRWKLLHRAIYPATLLAALHFLWLVKADHREPLIYLAIALTLLAFRLPWSRRRGSRTPVA